MNISASQDMSDEKASEVDLGKVPEKTAQIFGHGEVSIVQHQDGKNTISNLTSKEQSAQLSKIPHKDVLTTETKNRSVIYQDKVQGDSQLCV